MAGQIKVNSVQLGDSVTASQNFVWQTNADGTAKLARGNVGATTQDIMTVDAAGKVSFPQGELPVRVWTAATLVAGTPYVNNTGAEMVLELTIISVTSGIFFATFTGVGSVQGTASAAAWVLSGLVIVPIGATYTLSLGNATLSSARKLSA
jgi:hypothetical protein